MTINNLRKRLIRGSFWSLLGKAVQTITGFASVPLTLQYLGMERMGLWRLTVSMMAIASFIQAGIVPHIKTKMTESFADNDIRMYTKYCSAGILLSVAVMAVGGLAAFFAHYVNWVGIMNVTDPLAQQEAFPLIIVIIICTFAQVSTSFIPAIYEARMQLSKPKIFELAGQISGFLMLLMGIHWRVGLPVLAGMVVAPTILSRLAMMKEIIAQHPDILRPEPGVILGIIKGLARPALFAMGIQVATVIVGAAPSFIIARTLSLSDVTFFSVSYQIAQIPLMLLAAVAPVFWPAFTALWRSDKRSVLKGAFIRICYITAGLCAAYAFCSVIMGPWIIRIWTSGKVDPSRTFLMLLGVFVMGQALHHWLSTFFWSLKELGIQLVTQIISALTIIVAGYFLSIQLGVTGLAIAMSISLYGGALFPMCWRAWQLFTGRRLAPSNARLLRDEKL